MPDADVIASKILIENKPAGAVCPLIGGNNLFTGEFKGMLDGTLGLTVMDQESWDSLWTTIGATPPGPLPEGAQAVFQAIRKGASREAIAFEPSKIAMAAAGSRIHIDWDRLHIAPEEDMNARSRFAVVLLPENGSLKASFNDVWPVREKSAQDRAFKESLSLFQTGIKRPDAPAVSVAFNKYHARTQGMNRAKVTYRHTSKSPVHYRKPRVKGRGTMQM